MVHVPQILKVSAKALKPAVLTGVALVQAHPVGAALTVVAIVGVGLAIYYTKHSKNRKREDNLKYSSHENMGHSKDSNSYYYDPETKSIITDVSQSTALHDKKTLRKRRATKSASFKNENNPAHTLDDKMSNLMFSKEGDTEVPDNNLNTDCNNILPDDILDAAKVLTGEEKVHEFIENVSETQFIEANDRPGDKFHSIETTNENSLNLSCGSNSGSYWFDDSFLDLADFRSESSVGTLLPELSNSCRACRKNPVNTHTAPCNHRYMCDDCAIRIFRLFKRCKVCRARIEEIIVEAS